MPLADVKRHSTAIAKDHGKQQNQANAPDELHLGAMIAIDVGAEARPFLKMVKRGSRVEDESPIDEIFEAGQARRGIGGGALEEGFGEGHAHLREVKGQKEREGPRKDGDDPNQDQKGVVLVSGEVGSFPAEEEAKIKHQAEENIGQGRIGEVRPALRLARVESQKQKGQGGQKADEHQKDAQITDDHLGAGDEARGFAIRVHLSLSCLFAWRRLC